MVASGARADIDWDKPLDWDADWDTGWDTGWDTDC